MSIFSGGVDAPKIRVSGSDAKRVMVGTGTEALEAWPGIEDVNYLFDFPNNDELKWAPINGFDLRTSTSASRAPNWCFNGMLVAGDTTALMYNTRLVDRQIDGDNLEVNVVFGDILNTMSVPSYVVLGSNITLTQMLIVEFGSDGCRLVKLTGGTVAYNQSYAMSFSSGDSINIKLLGQILKVARVRSGTSSPVTSRDIEPHYSEFRGVNGKQFVGFGISSNSSAWGSRLSKVTISGQSTYKRMTIAATRTGHMLIPQNSWTDVGSCVIHTGATIDIQFGQGAWVIANSSANRQFRIVVNGTVRGTTTDEGSALSVSNLTVPDDTIIRIEALSASSNSDHRWVKDGELQAFIPSEIASVPV